MRVENWNCIVTASRLMKYSLSGSFRHFFRDLMELCGS